MLLVMHQLVYVHIYKYISELFSAYVIVQCWYGLVIISETTYTGQIEYRHTKGFCLVSFAKFNVAILVKYYFIIK